MCLLFLIGIEVFKDRTLLLNPLNPLLVCPLPAYHVLPVIIDARVNLPPIPGEASNV